MEFSIFRKEKVNGHDLPLFLKYLFKTINMIDTFNKIVFTFAKLKSVQKRVGFEKNKLIN